MENKICCFLGHRKIEITFALKEKLKNVIENLIVEQGVRTFLFGSKSLFDDLCQEMVSALKNKYPYIRRIYVRCLYPVIEQDYALYLSKYFEDTYFPQKLEREGRAAYLERNRELIEASHFCVFYYNPDYQPYNRKSGTKAAFEYAQKCKKNNKDLEIINVYEC